MTRRTRLRLALFVAGILSLQACTLPYIASELERLGSEAIGKAAGSAETTVESDTHRGPTTLRLESSGGEVIQAGEAVELTASARIERTGEPLEDLVFFWRINGAAPEIQNSSTAESSRTYILQTQERESGMVYVITAYTEIDGIDASVTLSIRVCACKE